MQSTSQLWKTLFASNYHVADYKLVINNKEYGSEYLVNGQLTTTCDLFGGGSPRVGNCVATQMNASLYLQSGDIAKRSACELFVRLKSGNTISEWLSQGTFYIDKRSTSNNGVLTLRTYDAMLKGDQLMYTSTGDQGQWPKTDIQVVTSIATRLGVTLHSTVSTLLSHSYLVQYPGYGENGYTVREVLGYIGAMYGGNWIIDENNKLKFIPLSNGETPEPTEYTYNISTSSYTYLASDNVANLNVTMHAGSSNSTSLNSAMDISDVVEDYSNSTEPIRYSRVTIEVGTNDAGESVYYTSGTDTYDELTFTCPWGTQTMADNLVSELSDVIYRPFTATNSVLDPAFQIGDTVILDNVTSVIYNYTRYYELLFTSDISATVEEEMDSEYPYITNTEKEIKRSTAELKSSINIANNNISLEVSTRSSLFQDLSDRTDELDADITDQGARISVNADSITAETARATAEEGAIRSYVNFSDGVVTLGKSDSPYQAKLYNNKLAFEYGGDEVSYISSDKLYITKSEILSEQKIGNVVFIVKSDGSVSMKWRDD